MEAVIKCSYCGVAPVPHRSTWYFQSLEILLGPARRKLLFSAPGLVLQKGIDKFSHGLFVTLDKIGLVRSHDDINRLKFHRVKFLWQEATARNIAMKELRPLGLALDMYQAKVNNRDLVFTGLPRPENNYNPALDWVDDKWLLKKALLAAGLPVAAGGSCASYQQALEFFRKLCKPVIVKPRIGSRGRHASTFVYTEQQFKQAFKIAKQLCFWVIVEEHLNGPVFRGTVVNGQCVGVLGGDPPKVTGDGKHSIRELIAITNQNKSGDIKDIIIDHKMSEFLERNDLNLESVLPANKVVYLSEKIDINYGGSNFEAFEQTHPDNLKMFEDAAAIIGDPILGFDFICEDITKSWKDQRCGIIECNGMPFINVHHDPQFGAPRNIAGFVWDYVQSKM